MSRSKGRGAVQGNCGGWTEPRRDHPQGLTGTLAKLKAAKQGQTDGEICGRSGTQIRDAGVERDLGIRSISIRQ